jgi:hypothetical protein
MEEEHHPRQQPRRLNLRAHLGRQFQNQRNIRKIGRIILAQRLNVSPSVIERGERGSLSPRNMELPLLKRWAVELFCHLIIEPKPSHRAKTFSDLIERSIKRNTKLNISLKPYA